MNNVIRELDPRHFETDQHGNIKVFETNVVVPLEADRDEYELEDKTRLVYAKVTGLRVEETLSTPQYLSTTLTSAVAAAFNSAVLFLRDKEMVVMEGIPLRQIVKDNDNGQWYEVRAPGVNFKESSLKVFKNDTIGATDAIKILIQYVKPKN